MSDQEVQHGYDPTANPRSLRPVPDPDKLGEYQLEEERLSFRLQMYDRLRGMFGSRGFEDLSVLIQGELQQAVNALSDPKRVASEQSLAYVQGQIQTLTWLRDLPDRIVVLQETEKEQMREVRNAQKEAKAQARQPAATLDQGGN